MSKAYKKEIFFILFFVALFVFIRSIHFPLHLNFSSEPASHALDAFKLWKDKKISFVGPPISFQFNGRHLFQSSIGYYFMMLFLVPTGFDPLTASYTFMLFAAFSIIPLSIGTKLLLNKRAAYFILILYSLLPFYIDFTRFFWNPNFQFALTPYVILFMGLYKIKKNAIWLFLTAFLSGILLLFHFQFIIIIVGLFFYFAKKNSRKNLLLYIVGVVAGFSPFLLFELRNHFYNTQTALLFLQNFHAVFGGKGAGLSPHYILSSSLFLWLILLSWNRKKIKDIHLIALFTFLFVVTLFIYAPTPAHGYGMAKNWNYLYEKKLYEIIKKENLTSYNIVNLGYDTVAVVPKFMLIRDGVTENFDDYYHNQYLFVVSTTPDFMNDPKAPYETNTFRPSTVVKQWNINNTYGLYLLKREKSK